MVRDRIPAIVWMCVTCLAGTSAIPVDARPRDRDSREESCFVSVLGVDNPPTDQFPGATVSVRIMMRRTTLFETPRKPIQKPVFRNRITFSTAKSMPVGLVVMLWPAGDSDDRTTSGPDRTSMRAGGARRGQESSSGAEVLGIAFEELVGDYEDAPEPVQSSVASESRVRESRAADKARQGKGRPFKLCEVELAWPPVDAVHELECGGATLRIKTVMLKSRRSERDEKGH